MSLDYGRPSHVELNRGYSSFNEDDLHVSTMEVGEMNFAALLSEGPGRNNHQSTNSDRNMMDNMEQYGAVGGVNHQTLEPGRSPMNRQNISEGPNRNPQYSRNSFGNQNFQGQNFNQNVHSYGFNQYGPNFNQGYRSSGPIIRPNTNPGMNPRMRGDFRPRMGGPRL